MSATVRPTAGWGDDAEKRRALKALEKPAVGPSAYEGGTAGAPVESSDRCHD
jgi:hypothetical protein